MRYVAAYVLAVLGGKDEPTADDIRAIIESVGVEVDETNLGLVLEKLKGKNIQEIQEAGLARLATTPGMSNAPETGSDIVPTDAEPDKSKPGKVLDVVDDVDDDDDDGDFMIDIFG